MRKDQAIDQGVKDHGAQHRKFFPHRSLSEMSAHLMWRDVVDGRKFDPVMSAKIAAGHMIVDSMPSKLKEKMKFLQTLSNLF
ncbi:MAG: hypothetical protein Q8J76_12225 [Desulfobulbaceae bacterium]|nr:hypothetical protein [Desulfobulbaceae bacterium]